MIMSERKKIKTEAGTNQEQEGLETEVEPGLDLTQQEQIEQTEAIERELNEARQGFGELIESVDERYENPDSTLAGNPEQLEKYKEHNNQILEFCVERGVQKGLDPEKLRALEAASILHDLTKGEQPPKEMADIPNYVLAAHGEMAAQEIKDIFENHPEALSQILGENYSEEAAEEARGSIERAIRSHMGSNPGFMEGILSSVNKKLEEKELPLLEHPYPEEGDEVAETLLAADMRSLVDRSGRKKVLAIIEVTPFFRKKQVEEVCEEYQKMGIDLKPAEAALLGAFGSAEEAVEMIRNEEDKEWVREAFELSKEGDYDFEDEKVTYSEAIAKKERFETVKELQQERAKIEEIAGEVESSMPEEETETELESAPEEEDKFEALKIPEEVESGTVEMVGYQLYNSLLFFRKQGYLETENYQREKKSGKTGEALEGLAKKIVTLSGQAGKLEVQLGVILAQAGIGENLSDAVSASTSESELMDKLLKPYRGFPAVAMSEIVNRYEAWVKEQKGKQKTGQHLVVPFQNKIIFVPYSDEAVLSVTEDLKIRLVEENEGIQKAGGRITEEETKKKQKGITGQEQPPIVPGETFSPEEELLEVRQAPKEERHQALAEYKRKLAYQKEGLAKIQLDMTSKIMDNPDISFGELHEELDAFRQQYGLTFEQEAAARKVLMRYVQKHMAISDNREKYPDDKQFFEALFGRGPKGKIEIIEGPMTVYVRCHNLDDYAFIQSEAFLQKRDATPEEVKKANMSVGVNVDRSLVPGLEGTITAEKSHGTKFGRFARETFVHEEQHVIKRLFEETSYRENVFQRIKTAKTEGELRSAMEEYLRWTRGRGFESSEASAKNEILAYFKDGSSPKQIVDRLLLSREAGEFYNFAADWRKNMPSFFVRVLGEEHRELAEQVTRKVFVTEYRKIVKDGINAFSKLKAAGYSVEGAIALLTTEPLSRWGKVVSRLLAEKNRENSTKGGEQSRTTQGKIKSIISNIFRKKQKN